MSRILTRSFGAANAHLRAFVPAQTLLRSSISTLSTNPHIVRYPSPAQPPTTTSHRTLTNGPLPQKVFENQPTPNTNLLTYLDTPDPALSIGTTTALPPTPRSFTENRHFLRLLDAVLQESAHDDPDLKAQARAFAGPGAPSSFSQHRPSRRKMAGDGGAGGASAQGGAGGAGRGGHVHLSDARNPPDFGRIAFPEDILGSVEVDGSGEIIGKVVPSGTYRIVTNEGM